MADKAEPAASIWGSPTFQTRSQSKAESSTAEAASTYETMHSNIETGVVTFEEGSVSGARLAASKPAPFPSTAAYSASEAVYHDEGESSIFKAVFANSKLRRSSSQSTKAAYS